MNMSLLNKCLVVVLLVSGTTVINAQQLPHYSQYLLNGFVLNPAIAGMNDYNLVQSNVRYQWVGMNEAPRTFLVSANFAYNPKKVGIGGYMFTDIAGPITRTGINLAYAYHLDMGNDLRMSMGVFGGMLQYRINGSEIILADEEERYLFDEVETALIPDASLGTYFYTDEGFVGISFNHLFHTKIKQDLFDESSASFGYLSNHLFIAGGYKFELREDLEIEPSAFVKIVSPIPPQLDLSVRLFYQEQLWLGVSYRTEDAVSVMIGYEYKEMFHFGYSYDFTTSDLRLYSDGSHEVMLGYRFDSKKKKKTKVSGAMY